MFYFFIVIVFLDKRCFEDEDVFIEGEIKGSRGKFFFFGFNIGGLVFLVESCRNKYYGLVFRIC